MGTITLGLADDMKDETTIDFNWPRYQTKIAKDNFLETKFHAILFPADAPDWVDDGFTQEELEDLTGIARSTISARSSCVICST